jgi:two-component system chemotaxis response regulator CheY
MVMRKSLRTLLEQLQYTVIGEAKDGSEAVEMYLTLQPDVVTMDIQMPNMNGIEATKAILGKNPSARIVMISAADERNLVIEALKCGAKHYIIKPVSYEKVFEVLNKVIGN